MPFPGKVEHQLLLAPAAWLPCALDRRLASASLSSKAIIAILSKTRPIARMVLLLVRPIASLVLEPCVTQVGPKSHTNGIFTICSEGYWLAGWPRVWPPPPPGPAPAKEC